MPLNMLIPEFPFQIWASQKPKGESKNCPSAYQRKESRTELRKLNLTLNRMLKENSHEEIYKKMPLAFKRKCNWNCGLIQCLSKNSDGISFEAKVLQTNSCRRKQCYNPGFSPSLIKASISLTRPCSIIFMLGNPILSSRLSSWHERMLIFLFYIHLIVTHMELTILI